MHAAPVSLSDLERHASEVLPASEWAYISRGSCAGVTQQRNEACFREYLLRPRVLRGVGTPSLSTTLLGEQVSMPICIGPSVWHGMAHEVAELGPAGAAFKADTLYCMPIMATTPIERVAAANSTGLRWFQLYILNATREELTANIRTAERHGFKAIVLTVDCAIAGKRYSDERNKFSLPSHLELAFPVRGQKSFKGEGGTGLTGHLSTVGGDLGWDFVDWLISITRLPIVLKGICRSDDAILAVKHGASGVWVSNHGGRHLDAVPGSLQLLREVVGGLERIGSKIEVYMDGGVRNGTDVIKALYLGARAVFVAQPVFWGLAYKGEEGVSMVLELLRGELSLSMTLSGCKDVNALPKGLVVHRSDYLKSKL